jgi:cytochrome c biogenesis protein
MKTLIRFFSSVKLAIILLIILAAASILGTLIPQGRSVEEYAARYGQMSGLFTRLQLTGLYHSVWYLAILGLFALNILVCTLTRLGPKWRRGVRPPLGFDAKSVGAMKVKDKIKRNAAPADALGELKSAFGRAGYKIRSEIRDGRTNVLARKKIWGIFGSDIVHLGLLVIIAGGILSGLTGSREEMSLKEGQTIAVPGADFELRLDKFSTEYYPDGSVKDWKSALAVLESGKSVLERTIEVNHPLQHKGYRFYQSSYGWNWDNPAVLIELRKKSDPAYLKTIKLRVGERAALDDKDGTTVGVARFIPDFVLGESNAPETRSLQPNNPAALVEGFAGAEKVFSGWIFANYPDMDQMHKTKESDLSFKLKSFEAGQFSVVEAAKDKGVALIWLGCILLMAGLGLAFYWPTWEVRAVLENVQNKTDVTLGGLASKSREAFQAEFDSIAASLRRSK